MICTSFRPKVDFSQTTSIAGPRLDRSRTVATDSPLGQHVFSFPCDEPRVSHGPPPKVHTATRFPQCKRFGILHPIQMPSPKHNFGKTKRWSGDLTEIRFGVTFLTLAARNFGHRSHGCFHLLKKSANGLGQLDTSPIRLQRQRCTWPRGSRSHFCSKAQQAVAKRNSHTRLPRRQTHVSNGSSAMRASTKRKPLGNSMSRCRGFASS